MTKESLHILLIQIRPDETVKKHEFECFLRQTGLNASQVTGFDVFQDEPTLDCLDGIDGIIIGGSGEYLLSKGDIPNEIEKVRILVKEARRRDKPVLGVCFGAQILTQMLGGLIEHDPERKEMGTFEIKKTEHAGDCPLLSGIPDSFKAQLGHQDHISVLPPGAIHLASSDLSTHQAFTIPGEAIYALLFHPELDEPAIHFRLDYYADWYELGPESVEEFKEQTHEAPHAPKTLKRFIEEIVLKGKRYPKEEKE